MPLVVNSLLHEAVVNLSCKYFVQVKSQHVAMTVILLAGSITCDSQDIAC